MVVLNAGFLTIIGLLGRIDQAAVAAHGIGLRLQALAFVPGMSVSQATGAMVGNALGADDADEARAVFRSSVVLCTLIMSGLAALIIFMAGPIVSLFNVDPGSPIGTYAVMWMQLLGAGMPIVGLWVAYVGVFQGSGDTRTTLRINMWATLAIQIPLSIGMGVGLGWGPWGVWAAFPISFAVKAVLGTLAYRRGTWAKTGATV
jgi:Na+-driven multidrug efflux pump